MLTPIEVIDTAVKIGLGALISAGAAYFLAARGHEREIAKERLRRRRELLEGVAEQVESFSHVWLKYWALMLELVRVRAGGADWIESRYDVLTRVREELFHAFGSLTSAEAKLLLLGQKTTQKKMRAFGELARSVRAKLHPENGTLTEERLQRYRIEYLRAREEFFDELSAAYQAPAA